MHHLDTRGSLLAVGLQHAAFNASASLGLAGWEYVVGLIALTVVVAAVRRHSRGGVTTTRVTARPRSHLMITSARSPP